MLAAAGRRGLMVDSEKEQNNLTEENDKEERKSDKEEGSNSVGSGSD